MGENGHESNGNREGRNVLINKRVLASESEAMRAKQKTHPLPLADSNRMHLNMNPDLSTLVGLVWRYLWSHSVGSDAKPSMAEPWSRDGHVGNLLDQGLLTLGHR